MGLLRKKKDLSLGICSKPTVRKLFSWWHANLRIIIVIICSPAKRWMLPDPIKIMGFMSPGPTGGDGMGKISTADFFCFLPLLCRHRNPVSLQHMLPRGEHHSSYYCKNEHLSTYVSPGWRQSRDLRFWASEAARIKKMRVVRRAVLSLQHRERQRETWPGNPSWVQSTSHLGSLVILSDLSSCYLSLNNGKRSQLIWRFSTLAIPKALHNVAPIHP